MAFLEGEECAYSWNNSGASYTDFDVFASSYPTALRDSFSNLDITKDNLKALAEIRNTLAHNNGDLACNKNLNSLTLVSNANLPRVSISGSVVTLNEEFLEFVRLSTYVVRNYHGEF